MSHYKNTEGGFCEILDPRQVPAGYYQISVKDIYKENTAVSNAYFNSLPYDQKRQAEYPPMADYLDAVVKGDTVAQQAYIDACLAVKAKYPKL